MVANSTKAFIVITLIWEIAVGLLYGFFYRLNDAAYLAANLMPNTYEYSSTTAGTTSFLLNSSRFPFPQSVVAVSIILLIVGFAMVAGYIQRQSVTGMAFTLLIFALTVQNFFIFRSFWQYTSVNDPNGSSDFGNRYYQKLNYINYGNDPQKSYTYQSASLIDAIGAAIALYAGFTAVIGRIGLGEIFFLTWFGTFFYEMNSQILWRLWIPDNGFPSRAFGFGAALGIVSSLVLGKKEQTKDNPNYKSEYRIMGLAFLGIIFVWCSYPILVISSLFNSKDSQVVAMSGQVNIWLALAASVLGCYTASAFSYRKFSVHDMVFSSITGAIAFSSSTNINYNPGASTAVGFIAGFLCSFAQAKFKRRLNSGGVIDSNSVIFHFLVPSFLAAVVSSILQACEQSPATYVNGVTAFFYKGSLLSTSGRSAVAQGGYQIAGWCISVGIGAVVGFMVGVTYKVIHGFEKPDDYFNDRSLYRDEDSNRLNQYRVKPVERLSVGEKPETVVDSK